MKEIYGLSGEEEALAIETLKQESCEYCDGCGEVVIDVYDSNSHCYQPTETGKCICKLNDKEYEI